MAQADFTLAVDSLDSTQIRRVASNGFTPPNGGGSSVFVMHAVTNAAGCAALYYNDTGFNPTDTNKGLRATLAIKKLPSGGSQGFAPFLFIMLDPNSVEDTCYMLGIADAEPGHLVLLKGRPVDGLPDVSPGNSGVLRRSTEVIANNTWVHLYLEAVVNPGNDVVINVKKSDLGAHAVSSPSWVAIPGMDAFIDDAAGINSGSLPLTSGRGGFCMWSEESSRRCAFDHFTLTAQA